ncbi:MAG: TolB family protein [Candidatus Methylomirabilales bacterium]
MEIYLLDLKTGEERRLTADPATDMDPAISPDGRRIAFVSDRRGKFEVYLMDLDGTNLNRLTETDTFDIQPSFSPDGRWLAFERGGDIYAVDLKTKAFVNLTRSPSYEGGPSWGP